MLNRIINFSLKNRLPMCLLAVALAGCGRAPQSGQPVLVDAVVAQPAKFTGAIAVAGRVTQTDARRGTFVLGCEDGCVAMPVKFAGKMPALNSDVVVHGQIQKTAEGRYVFAAQEVECK